MEVNEFSGKMILITGTSRGIGKALAAYFVKEKAEVYAVSRTACDIQEPNFHFLKADIQDTEAILRWLDQKEVSLDILINNAGIICYENLLNVSREEIQKVFSVNVISTLCLCREIARRMMGQNRPGVIVNTISFAAKIPSVGSGIYAASKAALESLTKTMAAEWAPYGIRVNGYSPGVIETDMTAPAIQANREAMTDVIALHRIGTTEDVVKAVAFLAGSDSSYLTGINLEVSGGKLIVQNAGRAWKERKEREEGK